MFELLNQWNSGLDAYYCSTQKLNDWNDRNSILDFRFYGNFFSYLLILKTLPTSDKLNLEVFIPSLFQSCFKRHL